MVVELPSAEARFASSGSRTYIKSESAVKIGIVCQYHFEMGSTDGDRYPRRLPYAKCSDANCEKHCEKITYSMAVLKRNKITNESLGIRTWRLAKEEVVIGYRFE